MKWIFSTEKSRRASVQSGQDFGSKRRWEWPNLNLVRAGEKEISYEELPLSSDEESNDGTELLKSEIHLQPKTRLGDKLTAGIFVLSLCAFLVALVLQFSPVRGSFIRASCLRKLSTYSQSFTQHEIGEIADENLVAICAGPLLEHVKQEWIQYDSDDLPTKYVGSPHPQREKAWDDLVLSNKVRFGVPYDKIEMLNKSLETHQFQRVAGDQGGRAVGLAEMHHQLHCVGMLREYVYRDPVKHKIEGDALLYRKHMDHCIFVLLTNIRCMSDVTPVVFEANAADAEIWKPYTAPHLCRKYDLLSDWLQENLVEYNTSEHKQWNATSCKNS